MSSRSRLAAAVNLHWLIDPPERGAIAACLVVVEKQLPHRRSLLDQAAQPQSAPLVAVPQTAPCRCVHAPPVAKLLPELLLGTCKKILYIGLRLCSALQSRELSGVETRYTGILFIGKSLI
jgi:hypothetical protein